MRHDAVRDAVRQFRLESVAAALVAQIEPVLLVLLKDIFLDKDEELFGVRTEAGLDRTAFERAAGKGRASIGDILQALPAQANGANAQVNAAGDGATRIDLRGLGAARTLVLVNGRRIGAMASMPSESDCLFLEKPPVVPPLVPYQAIYRPGRPKKGTPPRTDVAQALVQQELPGRLVGPGEQVDRTLAGKMPVILGKKHVSAPKLSARRWPARTR